MFELTSLKYESCLETVSSFEITVSLNEKLHACPSCGGRVESKGAPAAIDIWDTPLSGKHVRYKFSGKRYKCSDNMCVENKCPSITYRGPDIHPTHRMTWRLWHHIQRLALKNSLKEIERQTGATVDQISPVVLSLAAILASHTFETPRVVAVDDIRFGKNKRFTVISNGADGIPLVMVNKLDAKEVARALHRVIDPAKAEIFVSDMNGSNLKLGKSSFKGIPHVADKWHVLDKMQKQMSRVVNQTANQLKMGPKAELKSWKMEFEGKFAAKDAKDRKAMLEGKAVVKRRPGPNKDEFEFQNKWDVLKAYPDVRAVYHARLLLRHVYRAKGRKMAEQRFDRFIAFGTSPAMPIEAAKAVMLLEQRRKEILAYFDIMWLHHDGRYAGATTSHAEARNAKIKEMWKRSRGIRNPDYLNLRVVFEPYVLGVTLVVCGRCARSEVLPPSDGLQRAVMDVRDPRANLCSHCAASP